VDQGHGDPEWLFYVLFFGSMLLLVVFLLVMICCFCNARNTDRAANDDIELQQRAVTEPRVNPEPRRAKTQPRHTKPKSSAKLEPIAGLSDLGWLNF
jgi:hypothetical protein